jgi:hypothetical protein
MSLAEKWATTQVYRQKSLAALLTRTAKGVTFAVLTGTPPARSF